MTKKDIWRSNAPFLAIVSLFHMCPTLILLSRQLVTRCILLIRHKSLQCLIIISKLHIVSASQNLLLINQVLDCKVLYEKFLYTGRYWILGNLLYVSFYYTGMPICQLCRLIHGIEKKRIGRQYNIVSYSRIVSLSYL